MHICLIPQTKLVVSVLWHRTAGLIVGGLFIASCTSPNSRNALPAVGATRTLPTTGVQSDFMVALARAGNLPGGLVPNDVRREMPSEWAALGVPDPTAAVMEIYKEQEAPKGSVSVLLYDSRPLVDQAVDSLKGPLWKTALIDAAGEESPVSVGERALLVLSNGPPAPTELLFVRCHVLVYIHLETGKTDRPPLIAYARNLDAILRPIACHQ